MKLAIMQPYLFPWIGYFQLIHSADRFVVYDDVSYRKGSWINRNRVLVGGRESLFTLPMQGASPNKPIYEVGVGDMERWGKRFLKTLSQEYRKAPHFAEVHALVSGVLGFEGDNLSDLLRHGIEVVCDHLGVATEIVPTSRSYGNEQLSGQDRVLDICEREGADVYINAIGGRSLYEPEDFRKLRPETCPRTEMQSFMLVFT
ncbi:MAG: WbqC family protein [Myxococcota bacterium]